jgi:hypothetical protein
MESTSSTTTFTSSNHFARSTQYSDSLASPNGKFIYIYIPI